MHLPRDMAAVGATAARDARRRRFLIPTAYVARGALGASFVRIAVAIIGVAAAESSPAAATQFGTKSVLFISSERSDMPAMRELEETIRGVFHESADPQIELFPEYFDFARFPVEQYAATNIQYLRERYAGQQIDLVMVATGFALEFVLSHRDELFPKAPIVFCATPDREIVRPQLPPDVTGVTGHFDIERTLKLIFALQPNVTEIVCVGGTSDFDRFWQEETRKVLERFVDMTRFRWIADESLNQTALELSRLPPSSAVFYITMLRDGGGHAMTATDAARDLCRVSKAPVYGLTAHFLDAGTVGGAVFDFGVNGRKAANLVLKVLRGEWVPAGSPELEIQNPLAVNWKALKKWNLSESQVPLDAEIRYEPASLWETHRTLILWTIFVVLIQSILIIGWLAQRLWRRQAESSLVESEKRFQIMADTAPVFVWMTGPDKLCTFVNQAWLDFTGRTMEEELGAGWTEVVHPDDVDDCLKTYSAAFDARMPFLLEYRTKRRDGEYRWLTDRGTPRYDAAGGFLGYLGACVDTTELREKEEALHESEERVTLATDAAHLGVWERDLVNDNFWISDKARELFRFDLSEAVTPAQFRARVHPEDLLLNDLARDNAIETKGGYELEYRVMLPDGTIRWMAGRARCILDKNGNVARLLGVIMDVTERKQSEQLFQLAAEGSHLGVWDWDEITGKLLWDGATREIFDVPRDEEITLDTFYNALFPPDLEQVRQVWRNALETGLPYEIEFRVQRSNGAIGWVHARARGYYDHNGKPLRMIGVVFDITDRKQAEERMAQLSQRNEMILNSTAEGILGLDLKGNHTFANAAATRMLGYESEDLLGHRGHTMWHHSRADGTPYPIKDCNIYAACRDGVVHTSSAEVFWRKDGTSFPVEYSSTPVFAEGRLAGAVVTFTDISERKQMEEEARRQREEINLLSRVSLLGEMTASLAHELNQPLSAIVGNANAGMRFIDRGKVDPDGLREILVDVAADGHRANDIIRNVRNTIKRGDVIRQLVNLNDVVTSVAHMVRPDAAVHSCEVKLSLADTLPAVVADPTQIQQVLINLVGNAFEAMRDKRANKRRVELSTEKNGNETICVAVRDYGVGISDGARARLFEQFFTTKEEGLGMGLAIVRSIIEAHGGTIEAENAKGGGARFYFTMPVSKEVPK